MGPPLDRAQFIRPIAHRGLHDRNAGIIENTGPAFLAAIEGGYGIECDLQPASDGTPMVFHDRALKRLIDADGLIDSHDDPGAKVRPRRHLVPPVEVDAEEDRLGEERETLEPERRPDDAAGVLHEARPQKSQLETQHRP